MVEFADGQKRLGGIGNYLSESIMKKQILNAGLLL